MFSLGGIYIKLLRTHWDEVVRMDNVTKSIYDKMNQLKNT